MHGKQLLLVVALLGALAALASPRPGAAQPPPSGLRPQVVAALHHDESPPLRDMRPLAPPAREPGKIREIARQPLPKAAKGPRAQEEPAATPEAPAPAPPMPSPTVSFEGVANVDNVSTTGFVVLPPDTNGDVGRSHYIQWVNLSFAIYDKSGTLLYGPVAGNTLWQGFGGPCEETNNGDPIALYDHLADRWFMSQFALPNFPNGPFFQCIAVSRTPDPLGAWARYVFSFAKMNDYPKFGVWPDGYYMSINQFAPVTFSWGGAGAAAFDRAQMLLGQPASMIYFDLFGVDPNFGGMLPADLDGPPPPAGTPNYFAEVDDATWIPPSDALRLWEFTANWANPPASTFGLGAPGLPNDVLPTASWAPLPCVTAGSRDCIPQPGVTSTAFLDAIGDRLMYRLAYRTFPGGFGALAVNHTVDAGGGRAGIKWYVLAKVGAGAWSILQDGLYAPADTSHRWMGSIAMDKDGNMALGFSIASGTVFPGIMYAGRLAADLLSTLPQTEVALQAGGGSQTHTASRWGDYSMMAVDPVDDCTFWYTNEYYSATSSAGWRTRIGSFKFPGCTPAVPVGTLQGAVTVGVSPIPEAKVTAICPGGAFSDFTDGSGNYKISPLPAGTCDVTAAAKGYTPLTQPGVVVTSGGTVTQNFSLTLMPGTALLEHFSTGATPTGWSVVTPGTAGLNWRFNNPCARPNMTGSMGGFAIADQDCLGVGNMDTELRTPTLNFSALGTVILEFDTDFLRWSGPPEEVADVDLSRDGGATWRNVWRRTGADYRGPRREVVDISQQAARRGAVIIRFHYYNTFFEWWWQVDNVWVHGLAGDAALVVNSLLDTPHPNDANGNGGMDAGETPDTSCPATCTLRAAVFAKNSSGDNPREIRFASGLAPTPNSPGTIALGSPLEIGLGAGVTPDNLSDGTIINGGPTLGNIAITCSGDFVAFTITSALNEVRNLLMNCFINVLILGEAADANLVRGNRMGTTPDGMAAGPGTPWAGVIIAAGADGNKVIGNLISHYIAAIAVADAPSVGNFIGGGNMLGTNATGTAAIPNAVGVVDVGARNTRIGRSPDGIGNIISGNTYIGVWLLGSRTAKIEGNCIGGGMPDCTVGVPNGDGVIASDNAIGADIGGNPVGNIIAFNTGAGVRLVCVGTCPGAPQTEAVSRSLQPVRRHLGRLSSLTGVPVPLSPDGGTSSVTIRSNVMASNGEAGIICDGVAAPGPCSAGVNGQIAPPAITGATFAGGGYLLWSGTHPSGRAGYAIELFVSFGGQGWIPLGMTTTGTGGAWSITAINFGGAVVATATDLDRNTSEFSAPAPSPLRPRRPGPPVTGGPVGPPVRDVTPRATPPPTPGPGPVGPPEQGAPRGR